MYTYICIYIYILWDTPWFLSIIKLAYIYNKVRWDYTLWYTFAKNYGKRQFLMGKSTLSLAIFNSKVQQITRG